MNKTGIIYFPKFINGCAAYIGKLRNLYNYDLNETAPQYKRGDRSEEVNILGLKGELIFSHFLHSQNVEHELNKLLDNKPVSSWDIKIGSKHFIDVKTIRTDSADFLVNEGAHRKNKGITHYAFVQIQTDQSAKYWVFSKSQVDNWEVKNVKYSNAYYLPINQNVTA